MMPSEMITPLVGLLSGVIGAAAAYLLGKRQIEAQVAIAQKAASTELSVAKEKLQSDNRLADASHKAIREFLLQEAWELRSFEAIKKHLPAFEDQELKKLLVAAGAVSFEEQATGRELWGLLERNSGKLAPTHDPRAPIASLVFSFPAAAEGPVAGHVPFGGIKPVAMAPALVPAIKPVAFAAPGLVPVAPMAARPAAAPPGKART